MYLESQKRSYQYLNQIIVDNKIPPSLLFYGPGGSGKGYLALDFAKKYLCLNRQGADACGVCISCSQVDTIRHPDIIFFSSRDIVNELLSLQYVSDEMLLKRYKQLIIGLFYKLEKKFTSGFFKIKKTSIVKKGDAGKGKFSAKDFIDKYYAREKNLIDADSVSVLNEIAEELINLSSFVNKDILPINGIRLIINMLSKRPMLSGKRVVIIEGIEHLKNEGANAFLKTLEEPPSGTVIILTAADQKNVLPTIRSRCAMVPVNKLKSVDIINLCKNEFGFANIKPVEGFGVFGYFKQYNKIDKTAHQEVIKFFDFLDVAEETSDFYEYFRQIVDTGVLKSFFNYLEALLIDVLTARELDIGQDKLIIRLLNNYSTQFLRKIIIDIKDSITGVEKNNLNPMIVLNSIFMSFYIERNIS